MRLTTMQHRPMRYDSRISQCALGSRCSRSRSQVSVAALGLKQLLGGGGAGGNSGSGGGSSARKQRDQLLDLLRSGEASSRRDPDAPNAEQMVDALACSQLPFREQLLGGGPWQVVFTKGGLQLWKATFKAGQLLSKRNTATQDLDPQPGRRTVVNRADYFGGGSVYVTASGTYEPLDDSAAMPKPIRANITAGMLHLFGLDIPLPIRGSGTFEVAYLDEEVRVFRSGSSYSVQVRNDRLPTLLGLQPAEE